MSYRIKIRSFEGPFDLLVYLIEHARMSIYDIEIAQITEQYIAYVEDMREADINVTSEFMVLAAELLRIKSLMLLPRTDSSEEALSAPEDPRTELAARLREYKAYKEASEMLKQRWEETSGIISKPQEDLSEYTKEPDEYLSLDVSRFKRAFEDFLLKKKRLEEIRGHHIRTEKQRITTESRIRDITGYFFRSRQKSKAPVDFMELVEKKRDRYDTALTFSSVLEMLKEQSLVAKQKYLFGNISLWATDKLFEGDAKPRTRAEEQES